MGLPYTKIALITALADLLQRHPSRCSIRIQSASWQLMAVGIEVILNARLCAAGELIAVGVVDALPRCLSSTYLFWDPDLPWLALGKLTALKEIAWVQAASARCPSLQWYHMVRPLQAPCTGH